MAKQRKLTAWSSHERKSTDSNSKTNLNFQNGVECFKYMWATARPLLAACCKWPSWAGVFSLSQYQHAAHLLLPSVWQAVVAWILTECKPIQIGLHGHEPSSCYSSIAWWLGFQNSKLLQLALEISALWILLFLSVWIYVLTSEYWSWSGPGVQCEVQPQTPVPNSGAEK